MEEYIRNQRPCDSQWFFPSILSTQHVTIKSFHIYIYVFFWSHTSIPTYNFGTIPHIHCITYNLSAGLSHTCGAHLLWLFLVKPFFTITFAFLSNHISLFLPLNHLNCIIIFLLFSSIKLAYLLLFNNSEFLITFFNTSTLVRRRAVHLFKFIHQVN